MVDVSGHAHVAIDVRSQVSDRSWCLDGDVSQSEWLSIECFPPSCCRAPDKLCFRRINLEPIRLRPICNLADAWQQPGLHFRHFTGVTGWINLAVIRERGVV